MKILHISRSDIHGGANIAGYRTFQAQQRAGIDARMLVQNKMGQDPRVTVIPSAPDHSLTPSTKMHHFLQMCYINGNRSSLSDTLFTLGLQGSVISHLPDVLEADVLHLHWIAGVVLLEDIRTLLDMGKFITWTLHDQWPFTAGYHYDFGAGGYAPQDFQTPCAQLKADPLSVNETLTLYKHSLLCHKNLSVISPSQWLADCSRKSYVLGERLTTVIPYTLDTRIFRPLDKTAMRQKWKLPSSGKIILFSGASGKEKRKGFDDAIQALEKILSARPAQCHVVKIGKQIKKTSGLSFPILDLGEIKSDNDMAEILSACDAILHPSLEDNLPNGILEALHCATPVIAYDVGGVSDMIRHGINGMLVPRGNIQQLANALEAFLDGRPTLAPFSSSDWLSEKYSETFHVKACMDFYKSAREADNRQAFSTPLPNPLEKWCSDPVYAIFAESFWHVDERLAQAKTTAKNRLLQLKELRKKNAETQ